MHRYSHHVILLIGVLVCGLTRAQAMESARAPAPHGLPPHRHDTTHFALYHNDSAAFATQLGGVLESVYARHLAVSREASLLPRTPTGTFQWLCVDDAAAVATELDTLAGTEHFHRQAFYSSQTDTVVLMRNEACPPSVNPATLPIETYWRCVSHEVAHQVAYRSGLQTPGVMYAFWIAEGLALNFETTASEHRAFASANVPRQQRLIDAYWSGRLGDLDEFICLLEAPTGEVKTLDAYAQAWGLVQFLHQRDPAILRRYLHALALRHPGARPTGALRWEFEQAFGPVETVRTEWLAYLQRLTAVAVAATAP